MTHIIAEAEIEALESVRRRHWSHDRVTGVSWGADLSIVSTKYVDDSVKIVSVGDATPAASAIHAGLV